MKTIKANVSIMLLVSVSRFVSDAEIAVSTTKLMAGADAAPFLS